MNNYFLKTILLENCPFSINAHELIETNNIPHEKNWITQQEKQHYKTNNRNTFPQIYLCKKNSNGTLFLGGYSELQNIFNIINSNKINIDTFMSNHTDWSLKSKLRLIQLLNKSINK